MTWLALVAVLAGILNSSLIGAQAHISVQKSTLTFELNGTIHHESRKVEGGIVTLKDEEDGFLVVLDYDRDIFMIKNMTSQTCFFSRLENIHVKKDEEKPIFVQEVAESSTGETGGVNGDVLLFKQGGKIPFSYVLLTNDVSVAGLCSSQPSYWLETKSISRQRREDCDARCGAELVVIGILIGIAIG